MINLRVILLGPLIALTACQAGSGDKEAGQQEDKSSSKDSTEQIAQKTAGADVKEIEEGIRSHIEKKTKAGNGYFRVKNDSQDLKLKLVRVHTEYIANLGPQRHFACVDLAEENGDVYDVDFFLEGKPGQMEVTQTTVHKLNGKPFYTWAQAGDGTWHRVPVDSASHKLMGVVEGEDAFEFRYEATLPKITGEAEMWIPIAKSDTFQTVEIASLDAPGEQRMLEDKEYGNTILYLELGPEHSGETVEIVYNVKRKEKQPYKDPEANPEMYTSATPLLPVDGRFGEIVDKALKGRHDDNKLAKARALYDYIIDNVQYKKAGKYGTGDAAYACDAKTGNCTEFHSFFISLARSADIPARFAIGAGIPSERDEGGINGYHCWAEFYAKSKWWPVDISEGNKYSALSTYYFGHHPANRIELSRGRDLELEPGPESGPIKFLAYPVLETGGEKTSVETTFSFNR